MECFGMRFKITFPKQSLKPYFKGHANDQFHSCVCEHSLKLTHKNKIKKGVRSV